MKMLAVPESLFDEGNGALRTTEGLFICQEEALFRFKTHAVIPDRFVIGDLFVKDESRRSLLCSATRDVIRVISDDAQIRDIKTSLIWSTVWLYEQWLIFGCRQSTFFTHFDGDVSFELPLKNAVLYAAAGQSLVFSCDTEDEQRMVQGVDLARQALAWSLAPDEYSSHVVIKSKARNTVVLAKSKRGKPLLLDSIDLSTGMILQSWQWNGKLIHSTQVGEKAYLLLDDEFVELDLITGEQRNLVLGIEHPFRYFLVDRGRLYLIGNFYSLESLEPPELRCYTLQNWELRCSWRFDGYAYGIGGTDLFQFGESVAVSFFNKAERPGWVFKRMLIGKPEDFSGERPELELQEFSLSVSRELGDTGIVSYRLSMSEEASFVDCLWQWEIGVFSIASTRAICTWADGNTPEAEFGGDITIDATGHEFSVDEVVALESMTARLNSELNRDKYVDPIQRKPLRVTLIGLKTK